MTGGPVIHYGSTPENSTEEESELHIDLTAITHAFKLSAEVGMKKKEVPSTSCPNE